MRKHLQTMALAILLTATTGCGSQPDLPFQYSYKSPDTVEVVINGATYEISQNGPPPAGLPFQYSFEQDGDLDIIVQGNSYEIESPYDIDGGDGKKKKKKKTGSSAKKSSATKSGANKK